MAIAFDTYSSNGANQSRDSGTYSWNHTVTGTNPMLIVYITNYSSSSDVVTGVTYNSVTVPRVNTALTATREPNGTRIYMYALVGCATGTNSVAVTVNSPNVYDFAAFSYTGVDQTNSATTFQQNTGAGTIGGGAATVTISSTPNQAWLMGIFRNGGGVALGGTGTTIRSYAFPADNNNKNSGLADSNGPLSSGSQSIQVTNNNPGGFSSTVFAVMAVPTALVNPNLGNISVNDTESETDVATILISLGTISVSDTEIVSDSFVDVLVVGGRRNISVSDLETETDNISILIVSTSPIITFRTATYPYGVLSQPFIFLKTVANQIELPVLSGETSDVFQFRIYNNFNLESDVASALNLTITTYDNTSHTQVTPLVTQQWINLQQNGYGSSSNGYTSYQDNPVFVGGLANQKGFTIGSDGNAGSNIVASLRGEGYGFIEVNAFANIPNGTSTGVAQAVITITYDWSI